MADSLSKQSSKSAENRAQSQLRTRGLGCTGENTEKKGTTEKDSGNLRGCHSSIQLKTKCKHVRKTPEAEERATQKGLEGTVTSAHIGQRIVPFPPAKLEGFMIHGSLDKLFRGIFPQW